MPDDEKNPDVPDQNNGGGDKPAETQDTHTEVDQHTEQQGDQAQGG